MQAFFSEFFRTSNRRARAVPSQDRTHGLARAWYFEPTPLRTWSGIAAGATKQATPTPQKRTVSPEFAARQPRTIAAWSKGVGGDHFPTVPGDQCLEDAHIDGIFDESDRAVGEAAIKPARMR